MPEDYTTLLRFLRAGAGNVLPVNWTEDNLWEALDQFHVRFAAKKQEFTESHNEQLRRVLDKKFFEDTVVTSSGNAILGDFSAIDYEYGISFVEGWFQPMYVLMDPRPKETLQPDGFLPMLQVEELARQYFGNCSDTLVCCVMDHGMSMIMNTQKPIEDCRQLCWMFLSLCSPKLSWYRGQNTISIGIGLPSTDLQQIPQLMETAKFAG